MAWMRTYFELASGLRETIKAPPGTGAALKAHFESVTKRLGLSVIRFQDNPPHWDRYSPPEHISNEVVSKAVFEHNRFVQELYRDMEIWSKTPLDEYEELTPEFTKSIWYGFSMLNLNYDRWTEDVYVGEMDMLFSVMQGKEKRGVTFGEDGLTDKQAAAVIGLFSFYFDKDDVGLTLPNNCSFLVTSDESYWCPSHGAWREDDVYDENDGLICPVAGCEEVIG